MKSFVIFIVVIAICCLHYGQKTYNRKYVRSTMNKKKYLIRSHDNSSKEVKAANLLASLSKKKQILCDHIGNSSKYQNHMGIQRLLRNQNVKLEELSYEFDNQAAYSINKGERIGICLRKKNGTIEEENTMLFVLLHELAHIMSVSYSHNEEFWSNFALLIDAAVECKIYKYRDFAQEPTTYCGHQISHTPR